MIVTYRRAIAAAGALAVAAVLIILFAPVARAGGDRQLLVGESAGGPFADNLPTSLFPGRYVPDQEVTRTFWVKNNSTDLARTIVTVLPADSANELSDALSFDVAIGDAQPAPGVPELPLECLTIPGRHLDPGEVQPVEVTMRIADLEGQAGMDEVASVDLVVSLTQTAGTGDIDICGDEGEQETDDPGGSDPGPGSDGQPDCTHDVVVSTGGTPTCVPTSVPAGSGSGYGGGGARDPETAGGWALALMGGGAALLLASRRRRREAAEAR